MKRKNPLHPRKVAVVAALALIVGWVGCGDDPSVNPDPVGSQVARSTKQRVTTPQVDSGDFQAQVNGNNDFAIDLYQQIRGASEDNLFYSPHSISVALAMLQAGARNNTEKEIADALEFRLGQDALHPVLNKLDLELNARGQGAKAADGKAFRLNVVNAIWGQQGFDFLPDYLDTLALNYDAGLRLMNFAEQPDPSRVAINDWVEQQTEGRIKDLLPQGSIDSLTRLVLTNAIYFNAAWATPFEPSATQNGSFQLLDGSAVTVPLMHGSVAGSHYKGADFEAVTLPYDGHELSMLVIVPDAGKFASVEQGLTSAVIDEVVTKASGAELTLTLPSFEFEAKLGLNDTLAALGMKDAFDDAAADFSGIDGQRDLFVTGVLHKAFVKVNEAGTEAAAATAVIVGTTSAPVPVTVVIDRPFIFAIRDHATNALIFVGRVLRP